MDHVIVIADFFPRTDFEKKPRQKYQIKNRIGDTLKLKETAFALFAMNASEKKRKTKAFKNR